MTSIESGVKIYQSLSKPPKDALKTIQAGRLKGKTDINPQWRYKAMTEAFGLVGFGWKYEVQKLWTEPGAGGEVLAFAQVAVFVRAADGESWSSPIVGVGGHKLVMAEKTGLTSNDEGFKMAITDAFSTALKMLGVAADIYAGRWDGSKYQDEPSPAPPSPAPASAPPPASPPKGGATTPEQSAKLNELCFAVRPDGSRVFSLEDIREFQKLRAEKTADELIAHVSAILAQRRAAQG